MAALFRDFKGHDSTVQKDFIDQLIAYLSDQSLQRGASWLIKHGIEAGVQLHASQIASIFNRLNALIDWQSKLHILQIMDDLPVPETQVNEVLKFVQSCQDSDKTLLRAWSYHGLFCLAPYDRDLQNRLHTIFDAAYETEPASVKARIRNLRKRMT